MGSSLKLISATIALVLLVPLFATVILLPFGSQAESGSMDWNEGDGFGAGIEFDVLHLYYAYSDEIIDMIMDTISEQSQGQAELNDFSITKGTINAYAMTGVTKVTDDEVTIEQSGGLEVHLKINAKTTVYDLPKEGVYTPEHDFTEEDYEDMVTISYFEVIIGLAQKFSVTFDKESMDVKEVSSTQLLSLSMEADFSKLPFVEFDEDMEVSYGNMNLLFTYDYNQTLSLGFIPSLSIPDLENGIEQGFGSEIEGMVIDLSFEGEVDLQITGDHRAVNELNMGIDLIFQGIAEDMPDAEGLDGFPIKLHEIYIPAEYLPEPGPSPVDMILFDVPELTIPVELFEIPLEIPWTISDGEETDLLVIHGLRTENSTMYWLWLEDVPVPGLFDIPLSQVFTDFHPDVDDFYIGGIPIIPDLADPLMWEELMEEPMDMMEELIVTMVYDMTGGAVEITRPIDYESMDMEDVMYVLRAIVSSILIISDDDDDISDTVPPVADAGSDKSVVEGATINFDGSASTDNVGIVNYTWTFTYDDQSITLYGVSPSFKFEIPGAYEVTLTVKDAAGNSDTDTLIITVEEAPDTEPPVADAGKNRTVKLNALVTFDGRKSTDNVGIVSYHWSILSPEGHEIHTSNQPLFSYRFTAGGTHTAILTVEDAAGNSDSATVTVFVDDLDTTDPRARAGSDVNIGLGGLVVFDGFASWDDVGIDNYTWTFNYDGQDRELYGVSPVFRFSAVGSYEVTLTVRDAAGNWDQDTMTVTVEGDTVPPIARAGPDRTVDERDWVVFDGSRSWDNVAVTGYEWTISHNTDPGFDDVTLDGMIVMYRFTDPGEYTVALNVTDAAGNWDVVSLTVTVVSTGDITPPIASITHSIHGKIVVFDGIASWDDVGIVNYTWNISSGGDVIKTLYGEAVFHMFTEAGVYEVTLTVRDDAGNEGSETVTVEITSASPTVRMLGGLTASAVVNEDVNKGTVQALDGSGSTGASSYTWTISHNTDPGFDDVVLDGEVAIYRFNVSGEYTVTLNVSDNGNFAEDVVTVTVHPEDNIPPISRPGSDGEVDVGTAVAFDGSRSWDNVAVTGYNWTILLDDEVVHVHDGVTFTYRFDVDGIYTVALNVSDAAGNYHNRSLTMTVNPDDNVDPVAVMASLPDVDMGALVVLDGSASYDNVAVTGYEWTITKDHVVVATLSGETTSYRFNVPGEYTVTLNVTDAAGNWNETSLQMTVSALDTTPPIADAGDDAEIRQDQVFVFDGSRSWDNVAVTNYTWTFTYDGQTVTLYGETPIHTFQEPGVYVVTLTAKDAEDNQDEDTVTITVLENWAPTIESDAPTGPVGDDEFIVGWSIVHAMEANETVTWSFSTNASFIQYSAANGTFWGTPDEVGSYHVTVTATSVDGTLETQVTYHINVTARVLVTGTVMDSSDLAVAGATISVDGVEVAVSGEDGNYSFLIEPGTYTLQATKEGHSFKSSTLTATTGSVAVTEITEDLAEDDDDDMTMYIGAAAAVVVILALLLVIKRRF